MRSSRSDVTTPRKRGFALEAAGKASSEPRSCQAIRGMEEPTVESKAPPFQFPVFKGAAADQCTTLLRASTGSVGGKSRTAEDRIVVNGSHGLPHFRGLLRDIAGNAVFSRPGESLEDRGVFRELPRTSSLGVSDLALSGVAQ